MTDPPDKGPAKHRGHNEGSIYQTKDGAWRGAISLGYGPEGKPRRKYVSGRTRAEVNRKVTRLLNDDQRGVSIASDIPTVKTFLTNWLADVVKPGERPRTYESYESICRVHLIPALGRHRLDKLTAQHVQAMLASKKAEGLRGRSLLNIRGVLRIALNQAMRWDLVYRNVVTLTDAPTLDRFEAKPMTPTEVVTFLTHVKDDRLVALYATAVTLGLRQGELLGLSWDDVDLARATLRVRRQLQWSSGKPRVPQLVEPKTEGSTRRLPIPDELVDALKRHRTRQLEGRLRAGGTWPAEWDLVFCSTVGTPLDPRNVTKRFQDLLGDAGLERRRFHDLRHTTGSFLTAEGIHPRLIMEILGHSQISTTMNTYAHVELDSLRGALAHATELFPQEAI